MKIILNISFSILFGLLMTRPVKKWGLPDVTCYLVGGLLLGPFFIGRLGLPGIGFYTLEEIEGLSLINKIALGFIAFSIGAEFKIEHLKKTGKQACVIGIVQAIVACLFVDIALFIVHIISPEIITLPIVITLGAIATATAPAATLMIVKQYHAEGELTSLLLPIVALDDAVGLIVFSVSFGIAKAISSSVVDIYSIIVSPLFEIGISLLAGSICGYLLTKTTNMFHNKNNRVALTLAFIFLAVALSMNEFEIGPIKFGLSSLLFCMMMSATFCNLYHDVDYVMRKEDNWTSVVLIVFFVISGADLDLSIFSQPIIIITGIIYIISRCAGKYYGSYISAKATNCSKGVTQNLGITLFPQAGVALGMCVTAMQLGDVQGSIIRNIVLFGVLIYELVGPSLTKMALMKVGDIKED